MSKRAKQVAATGGGRVVDRKTSWLRRYLANEGEIERLRGEITHWEDMALPGAVLDMTRGAAFAPGVGSSVERLYERVEALRAQLAAEVERRVALRYEMEGAISAVADERWQLLLRLRFIEGCSLEETALRMHYSYRQLCTISRQAVESVVIPGE